MKAGRFVTRVIRRIQAPPRTTPMSSRPSPSQSPTTGMSPAAPNSSVAAGLPFARCQSHVPLRKTPMSALRSLSIWPTTGMSAGSPPRVAFGSHPGAVDGGVGDEPLAGLVPARRGDPIAVPVGHQGAPATRGQRQGGLGRSSRPTGPDGPPARAGRARGRDRGRDVPRALVAAVEAGRDRQYRGRAGPAGPRPPRHPFEFAVAGIAASAETRTERGEGEDRADPATGAQSEHSSHRADEGIGTRTSFTRSSPRSLT